MMLSCREVAELLASGQLSFISKIGLKGHLLICSRCRDLRAQFVAIDRELTRIAQAPSELDPKLAEKIVSDVLNKDSK